MTVAAYTEMVRRILAGGNPSDDLEVTSAEVAAWLDTAIADAIRAAFDADNSIHGGWLSTYCRTTACNESCGPGVQYVDLPVSIIDLPGDKGVYQVYGKDCGRYERVRADYLRRFSTLEARKWSAKRRYWLQGERIYFYPLKDSCEVTLDLVSAPSSLALDKRVAIPAGAEGDVLSRVLEIGAMQKGIPTDTVENAVDDKR